MHKYKIFQDKDKRWKTTLPDDTKKNGRRLIANSMKKRRKRTKIQFLDFLMTLHWKTYILFGLNPVD